MTPIERLSAAIVSPRNPNRPALMPYLTAGFPSREGFASLVQRVGRVADAIEIGVPFSDPMADGVTIQESSRQALENGVTLPWILETMAAAQPAAPFVLMSYLNPLLAYGFERLVKDAASAGASGFIVPDLPWEEGGHFRELAHSQGLGVIQLVTPVTPDERLAMLCKGSGGFVYAVTVTGITGTAALPDQLVGYLDRVRAVSPVPVCAGFGIRSPEQVAWLGGHADGVVVGSAVIDVLAKGEDPIPFLKTLTGTA
jgi:tryptophan synthase alpha chain